ncbi:MAG: entericidin [Thalassospira sp.]
MSILVKRILAVALVAGFGFSLAACETAAGFGRDVEKLGEQIQEGVDK